ncbi:retrovirus-related pol polyprotein from transposon TNT 1-94 [Tanacetum coccineum]|uniref:Retrovirus-related pol polyprotein from transposon TNT 1-94 n=1 Tax=Tanacetum coccineum TaxID=301880 RepID=A0ABQ4WX11_9ASTR
MKWVKTDRCGWSGANGGISLEQYAGQERWRYQNGCKASTECRESESNGNGNVVAARAEGNAIGNNGNQIRCYNCKGLAKEFDLMAAASDLDEIEEVNANCILMANLQQASTSGTQTDKALVYDSDESAEIERLQAQLGDQKGKSMDTPCVSNTLDPLSRKLENKNVELELQVSEQEDTTKGTSMNTKFANQSTERKSSLQPLRNNFVVRQPNAIQSERTKFSKNRVPQKVDERNDLSNLVTSNSVPTPQESKVVKNDNVIGPGMFRINPFKPFREEKYVPNKVKASVRTNLIIVSQPHVITKKDVNSDSNGLSSMGVDNTAKTRRPQPRSNTQNDRVPSASKSSCSKNKEVKQCLTTANHDDCVLNYVNDMNSRGKKQKANISNIAKQTKVMKSKKVGSNERLASPKPSKPRSCLRWSRTGRLFNLKGKIIASSESESQFDCSNGDNATVSTNLYTINLHDMAFASLICLMARATSTKSWLWHQHLSHLNFDTINDLAKNDLVTGLPKFKYHKEHLCPSYEQGKSKRASHPPKLVPNSKQRLHLLHMDLCGPMRIARINGKRVVERRNQTLVKAAKTMLILSCASLFLWAEAIATAYYTQNRSIIHRQFNKTPYELINGRKPDISFLHVFGALYYPKNNREDIGKLGAKSDIGFVIGYSTDSCACRVYNRRTKKIMETMNVTFDELSAMAFKQSTSKPGLQGMTSGHISSGLDLTYASSTITTQQPTKGELDLLFEAMYDDHFGGQPSAAPRTVSAAQAPQVLQTPTVTTTTTDTVLTPTNSSSQETTLPNTSQDVDKLKTQQHVQHQPATIADNVPNAMFDENTFVNPFVTPSTSAVES